MDFEYDRLKCGKIVVIIIGISGPSTKMAKFTTYKRISELCLMYKWLLYQLIDIRRGKIGTSCHIYNKPRYLVYCIAIFKW